MAKKSKVNSKKINHKNVLYVIGAVIVIVLLFTLVLKYTGKELAGKATAVYTQVGGVDTLPVTITFAAGETEAEFLYNDKNYILSFAVDAATGALSNLGINLKPAEEGETGTDGEPTSGCTIDTDCADGETCTEGQCVVETQIATCNNDGVCDAGEDLENCPNDCNNPDLNIKSVTFEDVDSVIKVKITIENLGTIISQNGIGKLTLTKPSAIKLFDFNFDAIEPENSADYVVEITAQDYNAFKESFNWNIALMDITEQIILFTKTGTYISASSYCDDSNPCQKEGTVCTNNQCVDYAEDYNLYFGGGELIVSDIVVMAGPEEYNTLLSLPLCVGITSKNSITGQYKIGETAPTFKVRVKSFGDAGAYDIVDFLVTNKQFDVPNNCVDISQFFKPLKFLKTQLEDITTVNPDGTTTIDCTDCVFPVYVEIDPNMNLKETNTDDNAALAVVKMIFT